MRIFKSHPLLKLANSYHTGAPQPAKKNLAGNYITGFSDGESTFHISIYKNSKYRTGWAVIPSFTFGLHGKDLALLYQIQSYFGIGLIKRTKMDIYTIL